MADAITVSGPISWDRPDPLFETGQLAGRPTVPSSPGSATRWCSAPQPPPAKVAEGTDFFPLTVDIEERAYAAGKIPGSFFRREGRAGDRRR